MPNNLDTVYADNMLNNNNNNKNRYLKSIFHFVQFRKIDTRVGRRSYAFTYSRVRRRFYNNFKQFSLARLNANIHILNTRLLINKYFYYNCLVECFFFINLLTSSVVNRQPKLFKNAQIKNLYVKCSAINRSLKIQTKLMYTQYCIQYFRYINYNLILIGGQLGGRGG